MRARMQRGAVSSMIRQHAQVRQSAQRGAAGAWWWRGGPCGVTSRTSARSASRHGRGHVDPGGSQGGQGRHVTCSAVQVQADNARVWCAGSTRACKPPTTPTAAPSSPTQCSRPRSSASAGLPYAQLTLVAGKRYRVAVAAVNCVVEEPASACSCCGRHPPRRRHMGYIEQTDSMHARCTRPGGFRVSPALGPLRLRPRALQVQRCKWRDRTLASSGWASCYSR